MSSRLAFAALLLILITSPGWAQQTPPSRMSFTVGFGYDQGDFGTSETSRALYIPFGVRYTASRFDVGVSSSFARLNAPDGVRLIDGVPTPTTPGGPPLNESGIGDTVVRSRYFLAPSITPFVRLKIPTAPADRGLGTGRPDFGFGVEVDKDFGSAFLFGDLGYTIVGKLRGLNLRNRTTASIGVGTPLSDSVTVSGLLDWRRSIVIGNPNPTDLVGIVSYKLSPTTTLSPNAFVGLTDGSSDFGVGMQMRVKF
jgi:hypothetical protein